MRKLILITGLLVIVGMCIVPPMEVETVNALSESAVLSELGASADPESSTHYVPVWSEPEGPSGRSVRNSTLASQRLMLQVLIVAVLAGGLALIAGDE